MPTYIGKGADALLLALNAAGVTVNLKAGPTNNLIVDQGLPSTAPFFALNGSWPVALFGLDVGGATGEQPLTANNVAGAFFLATSPVGNQGLSFAQATLAGGSGALQNQGGLGTGPSVQNGGAATAPAAGATIVSLTPGAGSFNVWCTAAIDLGAPVAGDMANMRYFENLTGLVQLPYTTKFGGPFGPWRRTFGGADTISIKAIGVGSAGVVYAAGMWVIPVP